MRGGTLEDMWNPRGEVALEDLARGGDPTYEHWPCARGGVSEMTCARGICICKLPWISLLEGAMRRS